MLRRVLLLAGLLLLVFVGGGAAGLARSEPSLSTAGPTSVSGTDATATFQIAERTIRQVRYVDAGTLRYTFRVANNGRLPVSVLGLEDGQADPRLFTLLDLTPRDIGPGESADLTLAMTMTGCESLSSRAGSFVTAIEVRTRRAGLFEDVVRVTLPEEVHTGSPREAFCANSTATSRPPG